MISKDGSAGIAVGMATNIPPHNLSEVIEGIKALIDNPDITWTELMAHIPGPDFPTGGMVVVTLGVALFLVAMIKSLSLRVKAEADRMQ